MNKIFLKLGSMLLVLCSVISYAGDNQNSNVSDYLNKTFTKKSGSSSGTDTQKSEVNPPGQSNSAVSDYLDKRFTKKSYNSSSNSTSINSDKAGGNPSTETTPSVPTDTNKITDSDRSKTRANSDSIYTSYFNSVVVVSTGDGFGSGFFVKKSGYIITNEHVVSGSSKVNITLYDKSSLSADVIEVNKSKDLALLKTNGSSFPCLRVEDASNVKVGEDVIAIGIPKGLDWSVSKGIISAVRDYEGNTTIIQTDTAVNPGNSGGPLISSRTGKVVGIVTSKLLEVEGLNFAVASSEIFKAFPSLKSISD